MNWKGDKHICETWNVMTNTIVLIKNSFMVHWWIKEYETHFFIQTLKLVNTFWNLNIGSLPKLMEIDFLYFFWGGVDSFWTSNFIYYGKCEQPRACSLYQFPSSSSSFCSPSRVSYERPLGSFTTTWNQCSYHYRNVSSWRVSCSCSWGS